MDESSRLQTHRSYSQSRTGADRMLLVDNIQMECENTKVDSPGRPDAALGTAAIPRLSISHLMILTATCAISLALIRPQLQVLNANSELQTSGRYWIIAALNVAHAGTLGIVLAVTAILAHARWRARFRFAPGHWVAIIRSIIVPISVLFWGTYSDTHWNLGFVFACLAGISLLSALLSLMACIYVRPQRMWQLAFLACAAAASIQSIQYLLTRQPFLLQISPMLIGMLVFMIGLAAWLMDFRGRIPRDWLHHVGVFVLLISQLTGVAAYFAMRLFR